MPFPFLDLPPEIRERVYILLCTSPKPVPLSHARSSKLQILEEPEDALHPLFPSALLLTCQQLYHEGRPLYFSVNTFSLFLSRSTSEFQYFLSPSFRDNRLRIRSFQLGISRWGGNDFFIKTLAPLLSDMILNGSLRDLEVRAYKSHLLLNTRADKKIEFHARPGVQKLKTILEDPYLDRVVVKAYNLRSEHRSEQENCYQDMTHLLERSSQMVRR